MMNFRQALNSTSPLCFDGGMGTLLQKYGLPAGVSPELFAKNNFDVISSIHKEYINAGAQIITTNTFGGTHFKLEGGLEARSFNRDMAKIARQCAGVNVFVAGSVGPTGQMIAPFGSVLFQDLVLAYKEQILGLVEGGVDLILAETHFDLAEIRAVVVAAREVGNIPIGVSMTFEKGLTLTGTSPAVFVQTMQNMAVDLIATNCSAGPDEILPVVQEMGAYLCTPFLVQANAGLPTLVNGQTIFPMSPEEFVESSLKFLDYGATCIGGCCGTSPVSISLLRKALDKRKCRLIKKRESGIILTSRNDFVQINQAKPICLIGERINPTGKKRLSAGLQNGNFEYAMELAQEQVESNSTMLDVNVGAPNVDEMFVLPQLVTHLSNRFAAPLCIDSSHTKAIENTLPVYPASALINSINGEHDKIEKLGLLCAKYGAPFILLPLNGANLPITAKDRIVIIEELLKRAFDLGIPKYLIMVDVLALTVSSESESAKACIEVIKYCTEKLGLPTVCGLSNISFGLPARELLNASFLSMAVASGMRAVIVNPNVERIQDTIASSNVLLGLDYKATHFVSKYANWKPGQILQNLDLPKHNMDSEKTLSSLQLAILKGETEKIINLIEARLSSGEEAFALINKEMIPAIMLVGEKYEQRQYFLPQLLMSAEAMQIGFEKLKPLLDKKEKEVKACIIMATVEGDVHDIGKNIVTLMLQNFGFQVIDLGKDVSLAKILSAVKKHKAQIVGLSALMTTTMVKMEEIIVALRKDFPQVKVMVGGAVVTQEFATQIGAHGYAENAVAAVKVAQKL